MTFLTHARLGAFAISLVFAVSMPFAAQATSIDLDFGSFSQSSFGSGSNLQMQVEDVAAGINATLTAASNFTSAKNSSHGAASGDLHVNVKRGNSVDLTLALWDASVGTGFEAAYNPGESFTWDLVFYDLDGIVGNTTDNITLYSPSSYTVTETTDLTIDTSVEGQVKFIGGGSNNVANAVDPDTGFTQAQADVAVSVQMMDTHFLTFNYEATGNQNTGRNLLIDGGTLSFDGFKTASGAVPPAVPLPASAVLMLSGLAAMGFSKRPRCKRTA